MVALIKTEYVMDKVNEGGGRNVYITRKPESPDEDIVFMVMPRDKWLDMGSPDTVTLSVRPGDHLNP